MMDEPIIKATTSEKGIAEKQGKDDGQSTIAIPKRMLGELEEYCRKNRIKKKDYVEKSLDYFLRNNISLLDDAFAYTPLEDIVDELKKVSSVMSGNNEGLKIMGKAFSGLQEQTVRQLQSQRMLESAAMKNEELTSKIDSLTQEIESLKEGKKKLESDLALALADLKRCASSIFSRPNKAVLTHLDKKDSY